MIDKLKFDLRIYVMVCGVDPLRVYFYKEGLCRMATQEYKPPAQSNLSNLFMHLTNYAINKYSDKFQQNHQTDGNEETGHKRSLSYVLKYIDELGYSSTEVLDRIKDVILKCLCAVQPMLAHTYRSCQPDDVENSMCFEILGFDVFLDDKLKPWILEVNHAPSFATDSSLDYKIKKGVIADAIKLLNLSAQRKQKYKRQKAAEF